MNERKWTSRKFWSQALAALAVTVFALWLEVQFIELREAKLISDEIYRQLAQGVFWIAAVFDGAAVGMYSLSNVAMERINKR